MRASALILKLGRRIRGENSKKKEIRMDVLSPGVDTAEIAIVPETTPFISGTILESGKSSLMI